MHRPDGDLVVGLSALVIVLLAIIGAILWGALDHNRTELEFSNQCQSQGKEVQYRYMRPESSVLVSECK